MRVRDSFERSTMLVMLGYVLETPAAEQALYRLGYWEGTDLSHAVAYMMGQQLQSTAERRERHRRARARKKRRVRR